MTSRTPTVSFTTYDDRRRPVRMRTERSPNAHGELEEDRPLEDVSTPHDQMLVWDLADNLIAIEDLRDPTEWPDGFRPQSVAVTHDSLYRVAGAEYEYTTDSGSRTAIDDTSASNDWRTEMAIGRSNDPMRTAPAPLVSDEPDQRVVSMTWEHDWLGNMQSWDDDSAVFYERSLGEIVNGADLPSEAPSRRTGALYVASNLPATPVTADDGGWVEVRYGEDGNALAVTVHGRCGDPDENEIELDCRTGTDDPEEAVDLSCAYSCATEQHFTYAWDEVNRIAHARRLDREDGGDWELAVEQRYLYDANNQRTVKTTTFRGIESSTERSALYVYPGDFERRGLERSSEFSTFGPGRYEAVAGDTETQYGVGGARIVWRTSDRDDTLDRDQRITLSLTDLIQSTTAVIDLATGELVEAGSFYANGARERYRSNETETVTPEPMGFTGKEADEEVGLTYFGHRYLMAHLGRWASPDPLQTHAVGGGEALNGYHYVGGTILQARDPVGLDPEITVHETPTDVQITVHLVVVSWGLTAEAEAAGRSEIEAVAEMYRQQGRSWTGGDGRTYSLSFDISVRSINATERDALARVAQNVWRGMSRAAQRRVGDLFVPGGPGDPYDTGFPYQSVPEVDRALARSARQMGINVVLFGGIAVPSGRHGLEATGATYTRMLHTQDVHGLAHEMGHMLGLNERYASTDGGRTGHSIPGFEHNIMGVASGTELDDAQIRWLAARAMDLARSGQHTMSFGYDSVGPPTAFRGGGIGPEFRLRSHTSTVPPRSGYGCGCSAAGIGR